jgi:hypothetical protein
MRFARELQVRPVHSDHIEGFGRTVPERLDQGVHAEHRQIPALNGLRGFGIFERFLWNLKPPHSSRSAVLTPWSRCDRNSGKADPPEQH